MINSALKSASNHVRTKLQLVSGGSMAGQGPQPPLRSLRPSVVVLGLEMSSRTNFESLALALKVKSLDLALRVKSLVNSPGHLRATQTMT